MPPADEEGKRGRRRPASMELGKQQDGKDNAPLLVQPPAQRDLMKHRRLHRRRNSRDERRHCCDHSHACGRT